MYKMVLITNQSGIITTIENVFDLEVFEVIRASDTLSGLWYIEASDPDVIVLDLGQPELSRVIIASRLNHLSRRIPIVALTANATLSNYQVAVACGCRTMMELPIEEGQFVRDIAAFLPVRV